MPKPPKVEKPKLPIEADSARDEGSAQARAARPQGRESFISAGTLKRKAFTIKSSLLGI